MKSIGRRKAPPPPPAWHPDFRDARALPDVKPVRTAFFVNVLAVTLVVALVLAFGYVEVKRKDIRGQIGQLEERVVENRDRNREVVGLYREFVQRQRFMEQIIEFEDAPLQVSVFLEALGESLPEGIAISNLRYQHTGGGQVTGSQIIINGSVVGTPDEASERVSDYLHIFDEHPVLSENISRAQLTSLAPSDERGLMAFGIQLVYQSE